MIPDSEKVITAYLNANLSERVTGETPSNIEDPWVRVTLIDDEATDGGIANRAFACYFQIDCFAGRLGSQSTARTLATAVRNYLADAHLTTHSGAVVLGAQTRVSRQPDTSTEPEMQRYVVTATVWMRGT